jgi:hypothetical protein
MQRVERGESADKPGSVVNSHSSRVHVAVYLKRPTRGPARAARCDPKTACPPIWSCSGWGLPCHRCYHRRGALLPHHFNLTVPPRGGSWRCIFCGTFRGLAPPRSYLAPCPVEPGLSSPAGSHPRRRLSGQLPRAVYPPRRLAPRTGPTARRPPLDDPTRTVIKAVAFRDPVECLPAPCRPRTGSIQGQPTAGISRRKNSGCARAARWISAL